MRGRGEAIGLIALRDEPRRDAPEGIARLKAMGVRSVMLTGDNRRTAQAIAKGLVSNAAPSFCRRTSSARRPDRRPGSPESRGSRAPA
ncbi:HAD family hydrolase [Paracoccus mutanolyticus]|uniref:HAD family hydrolase n=1 Tax=Paracoccus mutanolyticus TaxID=1499308 RepID=UPI001CB89013|nr:HAD family hydrolase [Paracoccus mutanolyticus]